MLQCQIYFDDIIISGKTMDEHLERLKKVLLRLQKANLKLRPEKCHMLKNEVRFLGQIVIQMG